MFEPENDQRVHCSQNVEKRDKGVEENLQIEIRMPRHKDICQNIRSGKPEKSVNKNGDNKDRVRFIMKGGKNKNII